MAGSKLQLTSLDKVFFPKSNLTKGDLVSYYRQVSKYMVPYLKGRPHSLLRHPDGASGHSFFQKDLSREAPSWLKTKRVHSESTGEDIRYLVVSDADSLLYMVQLGCIEINPWNSTVQRMAKPDWLVLDLDPEGIDFKAVINTAQAIKQLADQLKLKSYPKTSGKTGIHVYFPVAAKYSYEQVRQFAEILAQHIHQQLPDITSVERNPKKRRRKVYIDYLQNSQGQTLVAPYSVRPTAEATVSTPLKWDEVNNRLLPTKFTVNNIPSRLNQVGDLWKPVLGEGSNLRSALSRLPQNH